MPFLNECVKEHKVIKILMRKQTLFANHGGGGLKSLSSVHVLLRFMPYLEEGTFQEGQPLRKRKMVPEEKGAFIQPLKASFMANPRLMPCSRIMIAMLAGWAGKGTSIKTTVGAIGRNLNRCARQVHRYLKDAQEEGYLVYSRTKDRMGYYTGIQIYLNFGTIRHFYKRRSGDNKPQSRRNGALTPMSDTKYNYLLKDQVDEDITTRLMRMAQNLGYEFPDMTTT